MVSYLILVSKHLKKCATMCHFFYRENIILEWHKTTMVGHNYNKENIPDHDNQRTDMWK
jgi:hypothetical protein